MAQKRKRVSRGVLCAVLSLLWSPPASALSQDTPERPKDSTQPTPIAVSINKATVIRLPTPAKTVFIANPDIADVHVQNSMTILVYGKKVGTTTMYALDNKGGAIDYSVQVEGPSAELRTAIENGLPGAKVDVQGSPGGVTVSGTVASPADAHKLRSMAQQYLGDKDKLAFNVGVDQSTQVNLQVRVVEVSRQAESNFGFNWGAVFNNNSIAMGLITGRAPLNAVANAVTGTTATSFGDFARDASPLGLSSLGFGYRSSGGSVDISTLLDALQSEGLISVLAQPNLTAISGATSNFLAGGEFPVPVSQGLNQVTIEWKRFGVSVDFSPVVLNGNRISVTVRPEVSELSDAGSVVLNNIKIPGITVRRAETTVELASGQSFAIAGLYQNNVTNQIKDFPGLGELPIIGALLRSSSFQHHESELVIIVTPYIVHPVSQCVGSAHA